MNPSDKNIKIFIQVRNERKSQNEFRHQRNSNMVTMEDLNIESAQGRRDLEQTDQAVHEISKKDRIWIQSKQPAGDFAEWEAIQVRGLVQADWTISANQHPRMICRIR